METKMEEKEKKEDYGNSVIIGDKEIYKYVYSVLKAIQPHNYEKYGGIKIKATEARMDKANAILALFKNLWLEEESRERKKTHIQKPDGSSYPLEVIEVTLKKHPKLRR